MESCNGPFGEFRRVSKPSTLASSRRLRLRVDDGPEASPTSHLKSRSALFLPPRCWEYAQDHATKAAVDGARCFFGRGIFFRSRRGAQTPSSEWSRNNGPATPRCPPFKDGSFVGCLIHHTRRSIDEAASKEGTHGGAGRRGIRSSIAMCGTRQSRGAWRVSPCPTPWPRTPFGLSPVLLWLLGGWT